jgi:hypothetical protein
MADGKFIGDLDDGGAILATDDIPIERAGADYRVRPGTAAAKAASSAGLDRLASVNGATVVGHVAVFADAQGTVSDGGPSAVNAPSLDSVLTTDFVPVVRGGQLYLVTAAALLAALPPAGTGGGQFDFSDPINSAYAAII